MYILNRTSRPSPCDDHADVGPLAFENSREKSGVWHKRTSKTQT